MRRSSGKGRHAVSDELQPAEADFAIRKALASDAQAIHQILQESPGAANWSEAGIRTSLNSSQTTALVSARDHHITGCIFGCRVEHEAEILNLAVKSIYRRNGEGNELVQQLLAAWQSQNVQRIFLEVRESNVGAVQFYERLGFQQIGRRKKYYSGPEEDALLLDRNGTPSNPQIGTR
jgi:[ribosomal protein S18]-alanine N-acetyltransferase